MSLEFQFAHEKRPALLDAARATGSLQGWCLGRAIVEHSGGIPIGALPPTDYVPTHDQAKKSARLEQFAFAERFGISRTPVSESLRVFLTSVLIAVQRRKGNVVATMSMEHLIGLFEVMSEFEGVCG